MSLTEAIFKIIQDTGFDKDPRLTREIVHAHTNRDSRLELGDMFLGLPRFSWLETSFELACFDPQKRPSKYFALKLAIHDTQNRDKPGAIVPVMSFEYDRFRDGSEYHGLNVPDFYVDKNLATPLMHGKHALKNVIEHVIAGRWVRLDEAPGYTHSHIGMSKPQHLTPVRGSIIPSAGGMPEAHP